MHINGLRLLMPFLLLGGGLVLWAVYNIFRFRGIERHTDALPVTPAEIGSGWVLGVPWACIIAVISLISCRMAAASSDPSQSIRSVA